MAQATAGEAERLLVNASRALRRARRRPPARQRRGSGSGRGASPGSAGPRCQRPSELLDATSRIVGQTRQRIAGTTPDGASRVVSLHDRQARPIAKGRLGKPVEFGLQSAGRRQR